MNELTFHSPLLLLLLPVVLLPARVAVSVEATDGAGNDEIRGHRAVP